MKNIDFKVLLLELSEGIVIMDDNRQILFLNKKAINITGWRMGESVPFCSYCQLRQVSEEEERCILANDHLIESFRSHIPNYVDCETDFDMSMTKLQLERQTFFVLLMKKLRVNQQEEKIKMQELLIHDTMLAQESERKRIAMELHDHIGQGIYSIYLGLDGIKRHVQDPKYHEKLEKLNSVIDDTLKSLKRLTKELRPRFYDQLGFETALKASIEDWRQLYKIDISLDMHIHESFENEKGLHLYRLIQEAIRNAVQHGQATVILIEIYTIDKELYFQVKDNGNGFEIDRLSGNGVGLKHMKERVKMFNGDIKWISKKGGPTRIEGYIQL